jgi:hypothetical protein
MNLFHRIDDAQAIVRAKGGVFKQAELYRRADRIYACWSRSTGRGAPRRPTSA